MEKLEMAKEAVKDIVALMKSVREFKIKEPITGMIKKVAQLIEEGRDEEAFKICREIVSTGRSALGGFIRYSVLQKPQKPQKDGEELKISEPFFVRVVRTREEDGYAEDIVARMKKYLRELEDAVRTETSADFTRRIAAHNKMHQVLDEAWEEQVARDKKAEFQYQMELKYGKKAGKSKKKDNTPDAELQRQAQRQQVVQKRAEEAKDFLSIL